MESLPAFERMLATLDVQLKPVAKKPFEFNDPELMAKLAGTRDPLNETGTRPVMEALVAEITEHYSNCAPGARAAIRDLFEKYDSAAWAATFTRFPSTAEGVRRELLLFSVLDQGKDTRDAVLWLQGIVAKARTAGINVKPLLEEAAGLSSGINKYGMGSTTELLLSTAV